MKKNKNSVCGVYKVTLPDGKIYIGQSTNVYYRIHAYKWHYKSLICNVYKAIAEQGIEGCTFEVLQECTKDQLDYFEYLYIKMYNARNPEIGFNIRPGGYSSGLAEETKEKLSKIKKELFKNDRDLYNRTVARIKSVPKSGRDNGMYGSGKSFVKFDLDFNLIAEYYSLFDIIETGELDCRNIYKCCYRRKLCKTVKGFIWRFKDDCVIKDGKLIEDLIINDYSKISQYKGVKFIPIEDKWAASYWSRPLKKYLRVGTFETEIKAYRAYLHYKEKYENSNGYTLFI